VKQAFRRSEAFVKTTTSNGVDTMPVDAPAPSRALALYLASAVQGDRWSAPNGAMLEVDAYLPRFGEEGHLRAIRAWAESKFNRVKDLVAEGYVGRVLSCTMIITTPAWGPAFARDWAYMADRLNGNTLMTSPGGHSIDALCYCLGEFKELSSGVANQRELRLSRRARQSR
jgi:hypothetical protein